MVLCLINEPVKQQQTKFVWMRFCLVSKHFNNKRNRKNCQEGIFEARLHSPIKYIIDLFPDVRSQAEKLAIDPVKGGFQEVPFSWVFAVKQF